MNLRELYSKRDSAISAREELLSKDELTAEDAAKDDELAAEIDAISGRIDRLESVERSRHDAAFAASAGPRPAKDEVATITGGEPRFKADKNKGFKNPNEFLLAVIEASSSHGPVRDERLKYLNVNMEFKTKDRISAAVGSDEAVVSNDPYGGFLVPEGFSGDLLSVGPEMNPFAGRTTRIPMRSLVVNIPARVDKNHTTSVSGGVTVTREPETEAGTASRVEYENVKLEAEELVGVSYASEKILRYSAISFVALLQSAFRDQFTYHMIDEVLNGNGAGEYQGVNDTGNLALVSVAEETTQTNATIIYENILNMRSRCWGYQNAIWIANHDTLPQLAAMAFTSSAIAPIWQPSLREDVPDLLMGRPLYFTEYAQTLGTAGDIMLLNMSQYLEGVLQPLESAESIHVRFLNRERTFLFTMMNAGAPWWRSALTPKNSSSTLSPFVRLATRA